MRLKPIDSTILILSKSEVSTFAEIKQGELGSSSLNFGIIGVVSENEATPKLSLRNLSKSNEESKTF